MSSLALRLLAAQQFAQGPNTNLYMWGNNTYGQLGATAAPAYYSWSQLTAGDSHTVAIRNDGTLWAWGSNRFGQLGDGTTTNKNSPVQVSTYSWLQVSAGAMHTAAIRNDGTLWAWGNNNYNQLNDYLLPNSSYPVLISSDSWSQISAGGIHNSAIKQDGSLWTWGGNTSGQLGFKNVFTKVSLGISHLIGIRADGTVWTAGINTQGQLGDGTTVTRNFSLIPTAQIAGSWTNVQAGGTSSFAVRNDGTLWVWGGNGNGILGQNDTVSRSAPVQIPNVSNVVQVAAMYDAAGEVMMWRDSSYRVYGMGYNLTGGLSVGDGTTRSSPVQVGIPVGNDIFSTGNNHTISVATDGTLWAWGNNNAGQLALDNLATTYSSPVQIDSNTWIAISAGFDVTLGIKNNYTLWAWGANGVGQLGVGDTITRSSPVQIAGSWTSVTTAGGSVYANLLTNTNSEAQTTSLYSWGSNFYGQLGLGDTNNRSTPALVSTLTMREMTASYIGTFLCITDGNVIYGSGRNNKGQLGDNTTVDKSTLTSLPSSFAGFGPRAIATGYGGATAAISLDYKLWTWGDNTHGQLGSSTTVARSSPVQVGTSSWTMVSVGSSHMNGVDTTYRLLAWGNNQYGQLGLNDTVSRSSPVQVSGNSWTTVNANVRNTFAARIDATLWAWGTNETIYGLLGDNNTITRSSPVQVSIRSAQRGLRKITTGGQVFGGLDLGSRLWTWGNGSLGGRGDGTTVSKLIAVPTMSNKIWNDINFGPGSGKGIATDYKLWSWGDNTQGQLGDNTTINKSSPVQIGIGKSWATIATASSITSIIGVDTDNTLWGWGINRNNVLGLGESTSIARSSPTQIGNFGSVDWVDLTVNEYSLVQANGTVYTIGGSRTAALLFTSTPTVLPTFNLQYQRLTKVNNSSYSFVSAGKAHTAAITIDDTLFTWGDNSQGKLGDSTFVTRSSPVQVAGSWTKVSAGGNHTLALDSQYSLYSFGSNYSGQLGTNTGNSTPTWIKVHDGGNHILAIRSDNTLWAWGLNNSGQLGDGTSVTRSSPVQISGSWNNVSAGLRHTLAINYTGSLYAWGQNINGQLGLGNVRPSFKWKKFAVGTFVAAIAEDDTLWTWGYNSSGQLGDGTVVSRSQPLQIGVDKWADVSVGISYVLAKKVDGTVWAWGSAGLGELGNLSTATDYSSPIIVSGLPRINKVIAAEKTSAAIAEDGTLWMWGLNNVGALGDNTINSRSSPMQVGTAQYAYVSVTSSTVYAIRTDSTLWSWGGNTNGEIADGTTVYRSSPVQIPGSWSQVVGYNYAVALKTDGTLWTWGSNQFGRLGLGDTISRSSPVQLGSDTWVAINSFGATAMAKRADNTVWIWGDDAYGQMGQGTTGVNRSNPIQLTGFGANVDITKISSYNPMPVGLADGDGNIYMWGRNDYGQINDGTTLGRSIPAQLTAFENVSVPTQVTTGSWTQVAAGGYHSLAIKSDNTLYAWGLNDRGQVGTSGVLGTMLWTKIVGDLTQTYGIRSDGTLWGWGLNSSGQLAQGNTTARSSPALIGTGTYTDVASGDAHALAITTDGRLFGWGKNDFGQAGALSWAQITASQAALPYMFALRSDGSLWSWGKNVYGQLGDSTTTDRSSPVILAGSNSWLQVSAGGSHVLAKRDDNTLWAWGLNSSGQLGDGTTVSRSSPIQVGSAPRFATIISQMSAGDVNSMVISSNNKLWVWGNNTSGALGDGTTIHRSSPVQIASSWSTVSAYSSHSVAIDTLGQLYTWGLNTSGQLGQSNVIDRSSPVQVAGSWTSVDVGSNHTLAINNEGKLFAWGNNQSFQLGQGYAPGVSEYYATSFNGTTGYVSTSGVNLAPGTSSFTIEAWVYATSFAGTPTVSSVFGSWSVYFTTTGMLSFAIGGSGALSTTTAMTINTWNHIAIVREGTGASQFKYYLNGVNIFTGTQADDITSSSTFYIGELDTAATKYWPGYMSNFRVVIGTAVYTGAFAVPTSPLTTIQPSGTNIAAITGTNTRLLTFQDSTLKDNSSFARALSPSNGTVTQFKTNALFRPTMAGDSNSRSSPVQVGTSSWSQVRAGASTSAALDASYKLYTWGNNNNGQLGLPLISYTSVDGGNSYIRNDGRLYVWGRNDQGQLGLGDTGSRSSPVQLGTDSWLMVKSVNSDTALGFHMGIKADGTLWGWGNNTYGQLGDSTNILRSSPVQVAGSWINVAPGYIYTLALRDDYKLYAWGFNGQYNLGDGTSTNRNSPVLVSTDVTSWSQISAGAYNNLALDSTGMLYGWGQNNAGQILPTPLTFTQIGNALVLRSDGQLWMWGSNGGGPLGDGTVANRSSPVQVPGTWKAATTTGQGSSAYNTIAIRNDGTLWSWGNNVYGSLGDGTTDSRSSPVQVGSDTDWFATATQNNSDAQFAIKTNNTLWTWGQNAYGVTGDSTTILRSSPVQIAGSWSQVISDSNNVFAIDMQSRLYTWGLNNYGQLGTNNTVNRSSPVQLPGSWKQVSTAYNTVAAIDTLGRLYTWGWAQNGRLGNSTTIDRSSPVQIGASSWSVVGVTYGACAAITIDGKLFTWGNAGVLGDNSANSRSSPVQVGTSSWTHVASGYFAQLAVNVNNTLYTWSSVGVQVGDNTTVSKNSPVLTASTNLNLSSVLVPSISVPTLIGTSSWVAISAGNSFSMALKATDRSLWTWGSGTNGSLGHGLTTSRSSPVQVGVLSWSMINGSGVAAGITTTGGLFTWGFGLDGALGSGATASRSAPVQVATSSWTMVSIGGSNSIGLDVTNKLYTWGLGTYGDVGDNTVVTKSSPVLMNSLESSAYYPTLVNTSSWTAISATGYMMAGITSPMPILYAWGLNTPGNLGVGDTNSRSAPTQIITGPLIPNRSSPVQIASGSWSQVTAGNSFSGAIRSDGMMFTWGVNTSGQLGDGSTLNRSFPLQISTSSWTEIGSGSSHVVAIKQDNTVYAWGNNLFAQLGQGDQQSRSSPVQVTASSFTQISVGSNHAVGLIGTSIYGWGDNSFGQLGKTLAPTVWGDVVIGSTSYGLQNGNLYAWGATYAAANPGFGDGSTQNRSSPVQIGTLSDKYSLIANQTGPTNNFIVVVKQDTTLWAWGNNAQGQLGDGTTITRSSPVQVLLNQPGISKVIVSTSYAGALSSGGNLFTWGYNNLNQLGDGTVVSRSSPVQIASNVIDFALSEASGAYIKNNNTLWVWGLNNSGQLGLNDLVTRSSPVQVAGAWSKVVGATSNFAFMRLDGSIWSCGINTGGQIGDGTIVSKSSPVQIAASGPWLDMAAASAGSANSSFMAKKIDNSVWTWGANLNGMLGDGTTIYRSQPVQIFSSNVNASFTNSAAAYFTVRINNKLYGWGDGSLGKLGDGTVAFRSAPTQLGFVNDSQQKTPILLDNSNVYTKVSAGLTHTVALRSNGTAWVYGQNTYGQLGTGDTIHRSSPVQINASVTTSFNDIFGTGQQTRLQSDSVLFATGYGLSGALGDNTAISKSTSVQITSGPDTKYVVPLRVGLSSWNSVSGGYSHTVAIRSDSTLWAWGYNLGGPLGQAATVSRSSPVQIGTSSWVSVSAGNSFNTAIRTDNTLWTWGLNTSGQLGDGTTVSRSSPVQVAGIWIDSEAANTFAGAIAFNGTVWTWGANGSGVLGSTSLAARSSPVQVSTETYKALALSENSISTIDTYNNIKTWGDNLYGQLGNSGSFYSWSQLSGGQYHFMAIRSDSTLWTWGRNDAGQLGDNSTNARSSPVQLGTSSWLAVNAGGTHTVAIKADTTTWAWGLNTSGQLGDNSTINRSSPVQISTTLTNVAAGNLHTLATTSDGTLYAWGLNSSIQLGIYDAISRSSPTQVPTSVKFNKISGGVSHSMGISTVNKLYTWGSNLFGQAGFTSPVFAVPGTINTINKPGFITSEGKLYTWGSNNGDGALGAGTTIDRSSPVQVGTDTNWSAIYSGWGNGTSSAFKKSDGTLWLAGSNNNGQFGLGDTISRSSPVQLPAGPGRTWISFDIGNANSAGIKDDGSLWVIGNNGAGQLGDNTVIAKSSPIQVSAGSSWTKVAVGNGTMYAIRNDGTLWTWGSGNLGALGSGSTNYRSSPVQVGVNTFVDVKGGQDMGLAIDTLARLYVWGLNSSYGQLGDGTTVNKSGLTQVLGSWTMVITNSNYANIGLRTDGTLWGWGANGQGSIGDGTTASRSSPVQVTGGGLAAAAGSWTLVAPMYANTFAARRVDGTIWAWGLQPGNNTAVGYSSPILLASSTVAPLTINEPTKVGDSSWSQISAGITHSTAIRSDSKLFTWGSNVYGQLGVAFSYSQVAATSTNNIAILTQIGTIWTAGLNGNGQLGQNDTISRSSPVQVGGTAYNPARYKQVSMGGLGAIAIKSDDTIWGWGYNLDGSVGDNTSIARSSPVQISTGSWLFVSTTADTAATSRTSYAIRDNGTLWLWGSNSNGQLGDSSTTFRSSPVQIGIETWRFVSGSLLTTAAIRSDYTLWMWGNNTSGKLGQSDTINRSAPVQIPGSWSQVSIGGFASHVVALDMSGRLFTWGFGAAGQLGSGATASRSSPVQVGTLSYVSVAAGTSVTVAVDFSNRLYVWGAGAAGALGDGTTVGKSSPIQIAADKLWSSAIVGGDRVTAITTNNQLWMWGANVYGAFGENTTVYRSSPVQVATYIANYNLSSPTQVGSSNWLAVSAGDGFTAGLNSNNTLFTWGGTGVGELMDGSIARRSSPVQVGGSLSYSMIATGGATLLTVTNNDPAQGIKMITSGYNVNGQVGDNTIVNKSMPTSVLFSIADNKSNPVQITSDDYSGYYESSPVQVGSDSWSLISAGENHSLGTKSSGLLYAWGLNVNGQVGDSTTINKSSPVQISTATTWVDVAAGYNHNAVEKSDGSAYTFGNNSDGQLGDGT